MALEWWTDLQRTAASFAEFSKKDADALRRWAEEFRPIVEQILIPEAQSPPLEPRRREQLFSRSKPGRRLLEVSALSPFDFVTREFEHDVVRAGLLFLNGLREVDLRLPGFGHAIPALLASPSKAQMCVGGSGNLARGLMTDITEHGGEIRCGIELRGIVVRNGRAIGVELTTGEQVTVSSPRMWGSKSGGIHRISRRRCVVYRLFPTAFSGNARIPNQRLRTSRIHCQRMPLSSSGL